MTVAERLLEKRIEVRRGESKKNESGIAFPTPSLQKAPVLVNTVPVATPLGSKDVLPPGQSVSWWSLFGRPWSWVWRLALIGGLLLGVVLGALCMHFPQCHGLYALVLSTCVPATIVVFFSELAAHARQSFIPPLVAYVVGGGVSILLTLLALQHLVPEEFDIPALAGIWEEPAKGIVLLVFLWFFPGRANPLVGLSLGAAVGAGFASLETFGYAYNVRADGFPSTWVLLRRGALSPFMHVGWSAALGGAVWNAVLPSGERSSRGARVLGVVGVFVLMVTAHCVWNASGFGRLALLVWFVNMYYAVKGVKMVQQECARES